ncbi:MAG: AraC family transcriptional regulator [Pseudomonas sp.]
MRHESIVHPGQAGATARPATGADAVGPTPEHVRVLSITQATAATFADLYIGLALLVFIRTGAKKVVCPENGELIGESGDLVIFPPDSVVTLENRPLLHQGYRADGLCFPRALVAAVFADQYQGGGAGVQVVRAALQPAKVFDLIKATLDDQSLPPSIHRHRLLEPLIWLRDIGVRLPTRAERQPLGQIRSLIEATPGHPWRVAEVAARLAMSEATLRRSLARSGHGFARILLNTRLEKALGLLQTTTAPVSWIALECGFKTPSHFAESFRMRFGIQPSLIRSVER